MTILAKFSGSQNLVSSASFSLDRLYRYWLVREWDADLGTLAVVGLNPSIADEKNNDPTVSRCISWAFRLGYGRLLMLNMFAYCATEPRELWWQRDTRHIDITGGLRNCRTMLEGYCQQFEAKQIIAAWGKGGSTRQELFREGAWRLDCFRKNQDGSPAHPLYLPYTLKPQPWNY
jgi:hypothetical protein